MESRNRMQRILALVLAGATVLTLVLTAVIYLFGR